MPLWTANTKPKYLTASQKAATTLVNGNWVITYNKGNGRSYKEILVASASPDKSNIVTLPYDPVLIIIGDSNARGSAGQGTNTTDEAAYIASYVPDSKVQVLNASNAFAQYTPGTLTGLNSLSNTTKVGAEAGFIRRFRATYPNNTLYIIKIAAAGSTITRGALLASSSLTASISGNILSTTAVTGPAVASNQLVVGSGVPVGAIVNSLQGGTAPTQTFFMSKIGQTAALNATVASSSLDRYNPTASFSSTEGTLWPGLAGSITNGYRNKSLVGLSTLTNPKVVATLFMLGTNDKTLTAPVYGQYRTDAEALIASGKATWNLANTSPIVVAQVRGSDTGSLAVRAAQAAMVAADPQLQLMDMDSYNTNDGTHFMLADLDLIGDAVFTKAVF